MRTESVPESTWLQIISSLVSVDVWLQDDIMLIYCHGDISHGDINMVSDGSSAVTGAPESLTFDTTRQEPVLPLWHCCWVSRRGSGQHVSKVRDDQRLDRTGGCGRGNALESY